MGGSSQPNTFLRYFLIFTINAFEPNIPDTAKFVQEQSSQYKFLQLLIHQKILLRLSSSKNDVKTRKNPPTCKIPRDPSRITMFC